MLLLSGHSTYKPRSKGYKLQPFTRTGIVVGCIQISACETCNLLRLTPLRSPSHLSVLVICTETRNRATPGYSLESCSFALLQATAKVDCLQVIYMQTVHPAWAFFHGTTSTHLKASSCTACLLSTRKYHAGVRKTIIATQLIHMPTADQFLQTLVHVWATPGPPPPHPRPPSNPSLTHSPQQTSVHLKGNPFLD